MSAVGYISDTEELVKASWSLVHHDRPATFKLSAKSSVPPALSAKDLPGVQTQILNVRQIKRIDRHPVETDEDSSPEIISDTKTWLNWSMDLDNPNYSEDDWQADSESDMELDNGNGEQEPPELGNMSAAPNVPGLIRHILGSKKKVEKALLTVHIMETRRNNGIKKK